MKVVPFALAFIALNLSVGVAHAENYTHKCALDDEFAPWIVRVGPTQVKYSDPDQNCILAREPYASGPENHYIQNTDDCNGDTGVSFSINPVTLEAKLYFYHGIQIKEDTPLIYTLRMSCEESSYQD